MKFVALLSGGKDSCFNITHCQKWGHELVAAASLRPPEGIDELDSYLYQTVGQDAIEFVAKALDVPLYRRIISGTAVETRNEYGSRKGQKTEEAQNSEPQTVDGDETEDMYQLLQDVKRHHPDIEGVSVGAILSTYQRVRVEHVCRRLGLTALCYLWQRDQGALLQEMIDSGVNAILIKVAGIGLKPQHLGQSLAQMQPILRNLNARFGLHLCGEGGEYETLTLDCPAFKKKIKLLEVETVIQDDKDFATVAYMRIRSATLEEKPLILTQTSYPPSKPLLDSIAQRNYNAAASNYIRLEEATPPSAKAEGSFELLLTPSFVRHGKWIGIGNIQSNLNSSISIEEETVACFKQLKELLHSQRMDITNIIHINALLSSMADFPLFNRAYNTMFGTSPPARACVGVDLPNSRRVSLECLAFEAASAIDRFALHVQGISYWAPANIGPYSQAVIADQQVFISGQIGLIPPTMSMPEPFDFAKESSLALQHVRRIRDVLPGFSALNVEHTRNSEDSDEENVDLAMDDRKSYQGLIAWFTATNQLPRLITAIVSNFPTEAIESNEIAVVSGQIRAAKIDKASSITGFMTTPMSRPPILLVVPTALPKAASVEVQALLHQGISSETSISEDLDDTDDQRRISSQPENHFAQAPSSQLPSDSNSNLNSVVWRVETHKASDKHAFQIIWLQKKGMSSIELLDQLVQTSTDDIGPAVSIRAFYTATLDESTSTALQKLRKHSALTSIPVKGIFSISDQQDRPPVSWDIAFALICTKS